MLSGSPAPGVASPEAKDTGTCLRAASHPCGAGAPGSSHLSPLNQGSLSSFQRSCIMHYQLDSTKILRKTQENSCNIWWVLSATLNPSGLAERPGTFRGINRKRKPLGWRALAPCVTSPHPETDRLEAKQLRMCLLSKRELRY